MKREWMPDYAFIAKVPVIELREMYVRIMQRAPHFATEADEHAALQAMATMDFAHSGFMDDN